MAKNDRIEALRQTIGFWIHNPQSNMNWSRQQTQKRKESRLDYREIPEIRESRFAFVRVFRVARREKACLIRVY